MLVAVASSVRIGFLRLRWQVVAGSGRQEVEGGEPAHQGGPVLKAAVWRSENKTAIKAWNTVTCRLVILD